MGQIGPALVALGEWFAEQEDRKARQKQLEEEKALRQAAFAEEQRQWAEELKLKREELARSGQQARAEIEQRAEATRRAGALDIMNLIAGLPPEQGAGIIGSIEPRQLAPIGLEGWVQQYRPRDVTMEANVLSEVGKPLTQENMPLSRWTEEAPPLRDWASESGINKAGVAAFWQTALGVINDPAYGQLPPEEKKRIMDDLAASYGVPQLPFTPSGPSLPTMAEIARKSAQTEYYGERTADIAEQRPSRIEQRHAQTRLAQERAETEAELRPYEVKRLQAVIGKLTAEGELASTRADYQRFLIERGKKMLPSTISALEASANLRNAQARKAAQEALLTGEKARTSTSLKPTEKIKAIREAASALAQAKKAKILDPDDPNIKKIEGAITAQLRSLAPQMRNDLARLHDLMGRLGPKHPLTRAISAARSKYGYSASSIMKYPDVAAAMRKYGI